MIYPEDTRTLDGLARAPRAIGIGIVLGVIISLVIGLAALTGCTSPMQMTDDTIVVPDGGSIIISPDGTLLTVLDAHGALVWQGDPTK